MVHGHVVELVDRPLTCKVRGRRKERSREGWWHSTGCAGRPQVRLVKDAGPAVKAGYEETRSDVCRRSASC